MRRRKHRLVKTHFGCYHVEVFTPAGTPFKIGRVCHGEDGSWHYYTSFPWSIRPMRMYGPVKTRKEALRAMLEKHRQYLAE